MAFGALDNAKLNILKKTQNVSLFGRTPASRKFQEILDLEMEVH
jgi:hypothetical protein